MPRRYCSARSLATSSLNHGENQGGVQGEPRQDSLQKQEHERYRRPRIIVSSVIAGVVDVVRNQRFRNADFHHHQLRSDMEVEAEFVILTVEGPAPIRIARPAGGILN
jgi:hypothetical protein